MPKDKIKYAGIVWILRFIKYLPSINVVMDSEITVDSSPLMDLDATLMEYVVPEDNPPRVY